MVVVRDINLANDMEHGVIKMITHRERKRRRKARNEPAPATINITITFQEFKKLISQLGPSKWRLEYSNWPDFRAWMHQHDNKWNPNPYFEVYGVPIYKRDYLHTGMARLVNEINEASLSIALVSQEELERRDSSEQCR